MGHSESETWNKQDVVGKTWQKPIFIYFNSEDSFGVLGFLMNECDCYACANGIFGVLPNVNGKN